MKYDFENRALQLSDFTSLINRMSEALPENGITFKKIDLIEEASALIHKSVDEWCVIYYP